MDTTEKRNPTYWWVPMLFGVIFIITGIWILRSPVESYEKITKIIGVIILVSGTTQILFTVGNRKGIPGWGFQATGGIIDLVIGIILILNPSILLRIITLFVGIWLIVNSVTLIMRAAEARKEKQGYWKWEIILGVMLLLLALLFLWHPMIIGFTIAIWSAWAFIILGVFRIVLTIKLRRHSVRQHK
jgi:uncharacterized membrane protein HdeD (DUF308 family)